MTDVHLPVLLREVSEILDPVEGGIYIDATVGLGGHSEKILSMIGRDGIVIGIDRDEEALKRTEDRLKDRRLILKKGRFSEMERLLNEMNIKAADGILFDLGVSMMQFRDSGRGFSFFSDEVPDMRMDRTQGISAWDVINRYPEKDLTRILKEYGEESRAAKISRSIVIHRKGNGIGTCRELAEIVAKAAGRRGKIHPATKTFQAIRIEVNRELDELGHGLDAALRLLKKGGRLCVISYHSLEDRIVKNFIRDNAKKGILMPLLKKPLTPAADEIRINPSSRSAKLRGAERL